VEIFTEAVPVPGGSVPVADKIDKVAAEIFLFPPTVPIIAAYISKSVSSKTLRKLTKTIVHLNLLSVRDPDYSSCSLIKNDPPPLHNTVCSDILKEVYGTGGAGCIKNAFGCRI
jgi:hypothetical protein